MKIFVCFFPVLCTVTRKFKPDVGNLLEIFYHFCPCRLNVFVEVWFTMKENLRQGSIILNILRSIYYLKLIDTDSIHGWADIFIFF